MSPKKYLIPLAGAVLFLGGIIVGRGGLVAQQAPRPLPVDYETLYGQAMTLALVRKTLHERYVRPVEDERLMQGALRGMVGSLDAHSAFLTEEEYDELRMESEGAFEGIGIVVTSRNGWLEIVAPLARTPASRAGLRPGDRILEIEGRSTRSMTLWDASRLLRGRPGTAVSLRVMGPHRSEPLSITLVREKIETPSVYAEVLPGGEVGYVRMSSFQEDTAVDWVRAVERLREEGVRSVVLDLRNNGGGLLEEAVAVCDSLLEEGVLVSTRGRLASDGQTWSARSRGTLDFFPLAVLVNGYSASAAEIVAGAVQDHGRGTLVGERTFGKGTVQTILPLSDGSALKLTTARYYTPAGRSISEGGPDGGGGGLAPDCPVDLAPEVRRSLLESLSRDFGPPEDDPQLARALEALRRR